MNPHKAFHVYVHVWAFVWFHLLVTIDISLLRAKEHQCYRQSTCTSDVTHHLFTLTILSASGASTVPPRRAENILLHCRSWMSPHSMHLSHTNVYREPIQSWWAERKQHIHTHSAHTQMTDEMKNTGFTWDTITFYLAYLKNNEVIMISMSVDTAILVSLKNKGFA